MSLPRLTREAKRLPRVAATLGRTGARIVGYGKLAVDFGLSVWLTDGVNTGIRKIADRKAHLVGRGDIHRIRIR